MSDLSNTAAVTGGAGARARRARPTLEIAERFGVADRTVQRFNARGREVGTRPPWGDAVALHEWFIQFHRNAAPAWLEKARAEAEVRNPRSERPVALRAVPTVEMFPSAPSDEAEKGSMVEVTEGSDIAVARRIVGARRRELDLCEALPMNFEGRDGKIRNAQEAFFKAQEQLRRMEDHEAKATGRAREMVEQMKPALATVVRRYCDKLRGALLGYIAQESRAEVDGRIREVLDGFHGELESVSELEAVA